jgi:hypothetical protein
MYLNGNWTPRFTPPAKRHYTEAQIAELGALIAFHYGMQVFMRTLRAGHRRGI